MRASFYCKIKKHEQEGGKTVDDKNKNLSALLLPPNHRTAPCQTCTKGGAGDNS